jgi:endo-1,4-beta-D-glucanase Y
MRLSLLLVIYSSMALLVCGQPSRISMERAPQPRDTELGPLPPSPLEYESLGKIVRLPPRDWVVFLSQFMSERGRIVDRDNGDITHSESMGYGMLLAVAYQDRETFDRLLHWSEQNLQVREDNLFAWRWIPTPLGGEVNDLNNASDGDIMIAWALLRATRLWEDPEYARKAAAIISDLEQKCLIHTPYGLVLLPGESGFVHDYGVVVNLSYYVFPAFEDFARVDKRLDSPWARLLRDSVRLLEEARFSHAGLPADWILLSDGGVSLAPNFPPYFGFDAIRVPLNIAWWNRRNSLLTPVTDFWASFDQLSKIPAQVSLVPNIPDSDFFVSPGMQSVILFSQSTRRQRLLEMTQMPSINRSDGYYSSCLSLLTKLAILDQVVELEEATK